jgi:hypothetical protein
LVLAVASNGLWIGPACSSDGNHTALWKLVDKELNVYIVCQEGVRGLEHYEYTKLLFDQNGTVTLGKARATSRWGDEHQIVVCPEHDGYIYLNVGPAGWGNLDTGACIVLRVGAAGPDTLSEQVDETKLKKHRGFFTAVQYHTNA